MPNTYTWPSSRNYVILTQIREFPHLKTCHTCLLSDMYRPMYMCPRTSVDTCQTIDMFDMFYMYFQMRKLSIAHPIQRVLTYQILHPNRVITKIEGVDLGLHINMKCNTIQFMNKNQSHLLRIKGGVTNSLTQSI